MYASIVFFVYFFFWKREEIEENVEFEHEQDQRQTIAHSRWIAGIR